MAKLGQQVDVYCGRCKMERYHTVAAIGPNGSIERVVCGYCQTPRKYRDPARRTVAAPRRAAAASRPPPEPVGPPRPYRPTEQYEKGDVVDHARYGRGRVTEVRGDRIDVRFPDGTTRVFVHAAPK